MNSLDELEHMSAGEFIDKLEDDSEFQEEVLEALSKNEKFVEGMSTFLSMMASSFARFQKEYFPKIVEGLSALFTAMLKFAVNMTEYQEVAEKFSEIIYKAHWFHCSYFTSDAEFETSVIECYEKNCNNENVIALIDNLFFNFYDTKLDEIIGAVEDIDKNADRVALIKQAIRAYRHNDFYLTITALMTVFDRLVYERTAIPEWHNQRNLLDSFQKLTERHKRTLTFIACSRYQEQIKNEVYVNCDINADLPITGIPNRHMVMHGFQFNYATKKVALNSIIMITVLYCLPDIDKDRAEN